ncbi:MAG: restriction endonuclease [Gammaproteobacteria bacterium]|nr:MAG: restriction endonuclease [Gammaproteobacteria bacterium]
MSTETPPDLPHLLHEALSQLGWKCNPEHLVQRLHRLNIGLPREDEFAVVCSWLGYCTLVHKLDQTQSPSSSEGVFQVPDLLAVFQREGRLIPVLVEVKTSTEKKLSFKTDYYNKLKSYAKLLGLPMLIAWKFHGFWALFDINQMELAKTNYNIDFGKAMSESLLGVLAGDFSYTLPRGTGIHLRMRKEKLISSVRHDSEVHEEWHMVIEDALHVDGDGKKRRDLSPDVQALFFVNNLKEEQEHTSSHVHWRFLVQDDENKFAHMALVGLLNWYSSGSEPLNWREVVARIAPVPGITDFEATVKRALRAGVVKYIFHLQPQTMPAFLGAANLRNSSKTEAMGVPSE